MDGEPVAKLSIAPRSRDDARIAAHLDTFARRVEATPPGMCPLAVQLTMLQASGAQTCGKCVPCRDGIPQLAAMLKRVVDCDADEGVLEGLRALAEMIRDTSDCAIGYEAARSVLEGLDTFADEYASHVHVRVCQAGVGQTVPCETLCPAHVDVPAYIALTAAGDYAGAVNMVRKDNPFPTACAFVCEHPCETRCRRTLIDAPINIRGIKKFAVDQMPADQVAPPPRSVDTARTVAVIGGGPSGLTCAYFLALMGHRVTVFEERAQLGGMLRYGIPAYRFPRERLDEDIRGILNAGTITARCGERIGAHEMAEIADTYHAVYVAGKRVVVVGGGNVAMDCARTSVRAGADEVSVVYRRRKDDMTALPAEVESAIAEGVEMIVLEAPASIEVDERGHCTALITQPQMIGPVRGGRPAPVAADKPTRRIEADVILIAVGQNVVSGPFEEFGMQTTWGCFNADEHLAAEGHDHVFVGGDCQTGPSTVIRAIGAGKVAARNIDEFLGYHHKLPCGIEVPEPLPNDRTPKGRVEITERPARERRLDFDGVENGMSREEVVQECGRCLRCDRFGCGVMEGGRHQYA